MAVVRILLEAGFVGLLCYSMYASYRLKHYGRVAMDVIGIFLVLFVIVALRTA